MFAQIGYYICVPFAWLTRLFYSITGSYGIALILFTLVVKLVLLPFQLKSKKSMLRMNRMQGKIKDIQTRFANNKERQQQEMADLYAKEGINPMSGCLWSLIPFPILIALYSVIRRPLTRMMFVTQEVVDTLQNFFVEQGWYIIPEKADGYVEIKLAEIAHTHWDEVQSALAGKIDGLMNIDFTFLGINLGQQPEWNFFSHTDWSDPSVWGPALGLFLIPFISAGLSWLSMKISNMANPVNDAQAAASMKSMNIMMPLMSIWICFIMPAAMGIYWIANSVFGMIRDYVLTMKYKKQLDIEDAEKTAIRAEREKELEAKRLETERLRAEGKTEVNANTSKKNLRASEKQKNEERKAALERAERAARRERLGIQEAEIPASQVGNRRYARGRAYVPDRYSNPEAAEEQTLAAAAESEFAPAIDETIPDDIPAAVEETAAEETAAVEEASAEAAGEEVSEGAAEDDSAKTEE